MSSKSVSNHAATPSAKLHPAAKRLSGVLPASDADNSSHDIHCLKCNDISLGKRGGNGAQSRKSTGVSSGEYEKTSPHKVFAPIDEDEGSKNVEKKIREKLREIADKYEQNVRDFKEAFLEQAKQKSERLPLIEEKLNKLKGMKIPNRRNLLLQKHKAVLKLIEDKKLQQNERKYEDQIEKLKKLANSKEHALSNRAELKDDKIKKLNSKIEMLKHDAELMRKVLLEKKGRMTEMRDEYEATIGELKQNLNERQRLIDIMKISNDKLINTISDKAKDLKEKSKTLEESNAKFKNSMQGMIELIVKSRKSESDKRFKWISAVTGLIIIVVFTIIIKS
eukprot:TRINITY_DN6982_c0_g5_i1.p2 TRINITY_DN6982_c0_g5~~TRINITY_DN6982_c0_g5_i1.p2  ORF type:complete len:336 (-),score=76.16 TRINITY_DN6982_c0_g5_i1:26-1033(-)